MSAFETMPLAISEPAQMIPITVATCMMAGAPAFNRSYNASARTIRDTPKNTYMIRLVEKITIGFSISRATFWAGIGHAGVIENDDKENQSDEVGGCLVQRGKTTEFLQTSSCLSPSLNDTDEVRCFGVRACLDL